MALIEIRDKFTGELKESHDIDGSLKNWMRETVPSYRDDMVRPPYSAKLNGVEWPHDQHDATLLDSDKVEIVIEPRDPATIGYLVVAVLSAAYAYNTISNLPKNQESAPAGKSIYNPSARGNSVSPNAIIRELAGSMQVFPDVLSETRRYVDHREELSLLLCIGRGHFAASEANVYVSETRLIDQGGATINFYGPGESLASDAAAENWYTSKEVDGLELITETGSPPGIWAIDVSGNTFLSKQNGVETQFPFAVGEYFEITSSPSDTYNGFYTVESIGGLYLNLATVSRVRRPDGYNARTEIEANSRFSGNANDTIQSRTTRRIILEQPETPVYSAVTDVSVDWRGINGGVKYYGPYKAAPAGEASRYYEVDVLFFRGLSNVNDDGEEVNETVELQIQYREVGSAAWSTTPGTTFTAKSYDARAYTVEVDAGSEIEAEFRFRRVTKDADNINIASKVSISRLKARLETPTTYDDETVLTIKIDGEEALSRAAENQINLRGHTRKLPTISELEANSWDLSTAAGIDGSWTLANAIRVSTTDCTTAFDPTPGSPNAFIGFDFGEDDETIILSDDDYLRQLSLDTPGRIDMGNTYDFYKSWRLTPSLTSWLPDSASIAYTLGGERMFMVRQNASGDVNIITIRFNAAYILSSAVFLNSFAPGVEIATDDGVTITAKPDGTKYWLTSRTDSKIVEYEMLTPGSGSSGAANGTTFDASTIVGDLDVSDSTNLQAIDFSDYNGSGEPTRAYLMRTDGKIFRCDFGTAGDITTITDSGDSIDDYLPSGAEAKCIKVRSDYIYVSFISGGVGYIRTLRIVDIIDQRASRSPIRFAGLMLREALGDKADGKINWDQMQAMEAEAASTDKTLDADFSDETTLFDAIKTMLAPAMIEPSIKEGAFYPIKLKSGLSPSHMYTPDVMLNDGLQIDKSFYDPLEPDGVEVEYFDLDSNSNEVVQCLLPGDTGIRKKRIQLIGATNATLAWRAGMRERRRLHYKPDNYTFDTEMDALNSDFGDVVLLCSEVFAAQFVSVVDVYENESDDVIITTDADEIAFDDGTTYAAIRKPDGRMSGIYQIDDFGASANEFRLVSPVSLDFVPITDGSGDPSFVAIGSLEQLTKYAIIREINPGGDGQVSVTAEEYLEEIYADDNNEPS